MSRIGAPLDNGSDAVMRNRQAQQQQAERLRKRLERIRQGGGPEAQAKLLKRGKLPVRERIRRILDPGSDFLELSALAGWEQIPGMETPAAGIVTGIGEVHGQPVVFVANDPTVKGGTYFPLTVKKHLRAQEIAMACGLACVYLVDSGGAYLPLQAEVFPDRDHFGRIFCNQARLSALGFPQIACVLGSCTAGGAYVPAMADESVIVRGNGTIFLAGPPLVKAATGEEVEAEELGGADLHCRRSGVADHLAESEVEALAITRRILSHCPPRHGPEPRRKATWDLPAFAAAELPALIPDDIYRSPLDPREILARLLDGSELDEFKRLFGPTLVCGFGGIEGWPVGIIANNGVLYSECAAKAAHFIELCCQRRIPLLFLQNISGFMVGRRAEAEGIARHGARMVTAVACAAVPKITLLVGGSHGAGNYAMCGRAYDPDFLFAWPSAKISVMGGRQAAETLLQVRQDQLRSQGRESLDPAAAAAFKEPILESYARESDALEASARLWDDGVILPQDTRRVLSLALRACSLQRPPADTRFGVFRM
jgi:acetyl-CoA carboxylase carboxyltransferase component